MFYLNKQISESQLILNKKQSERSDLEDKVKRLSSSSLDLDLLDEQARIVLNFAQYDDFIILDK